MAGVKDSPKTVDGKTQNFRVLSTQKDPRSPPTPGSDTKARKNTKVDKLPKLMAMKVSGINDKRSMGKGSIDELDEDMTVRSGSSLDSKYQKKNILQPGQIINDGFGDDKDKDWVKNAQ